MTPERILPPEIAIDRISKFLKQNGFHFDLTALGQHVITHICKLVHEQFLPSVGSGKGLTIAQSEASALFEALEHLIGRGDLVDASNTVCLTIQEALNSALCFPEENLKKQINNTEPVLWDIFHSITTQEQLLIPSFIVDIPGGTRSSNALSNFDGGYSNSGTAIGLNYEETTLHALNELIERDAYSLLLLETFCRKNPKNLRLIDKATLPEKLKNLLQKCEEEMSMKVTLVNMTSDLQVPSIACFCDRRSDDNELLIGFGCSPSAEYAVERALLENVQVWKQRRLYPDQSPVYAKSEELILAKLPKIRECREQNYQKMIDKGYFNMEIFDDIQMVSKEIFGISDRYFSVSVALKKVVERFSEKSMSVFIKTLFNDKDSEIICIRACVLELEVFRLVTSGYLPVPNARGQKALQN